MPLNSKVDTTVRDGLLKAFAHCKFPALDTKRKLAECYGITVYQVDRWFVNKRRRYFSQNPTVQEGQ